MLSILDDNYSNQQVEIYDKYCDKAVLNSDHGLYGFARTPFVFQNALGSSQVHMDVLSVRVK